MTAPCSDRATAAAAEKSPPPAAAAEAVAVLLFVAMFVALARLLLLDVVADMPGISLTMDMEVEMVA